MMTLSPIEPCGQTRLALWISGIGLVAILASITYGETHVLEEPRQVARLAAEARPSVGDRHVGQHAQAGAGDRAVRAPDAPDRGHRGVAARKDAELLDAIRQVESGGVAHPKDGDHGKSIGPYQIQKAYWIDSGRSAATYQQARQEAPARAAVQDYWHRFARVALATGQMRELAACHHLGRNWRRGIEKDGAYWRRVQAAMKERAKR
jgi:hypothetical protein